MPRFGARHSPEVLERIRQRTAEAIERRRERLRILPADLRAVELGAPVRDELRPLVERGQAVTLALVAALGGSERVSPQMRLIAGDVGRLDVLIGMLFSRSLAAGDPEAAELSSRIGTLIGQRRSSLQALGLDERRVEIDLNTYMAQRSTPQAPAGAAIDAAAVAEAVASESAAQGARSARESGTRESSDAEAATDTRGAS